jgi:hypothetical protein
VHVAEAAVWSLLGPPSLEVRREAGPRLGKVSRPNYIRHHRLAEHDACVSPNVGRVVLARQFCALAPVKQWLANNPVSSRYPEVLESIFQYHTFYINDLATTHQFFVLRPPRMLRHVQSLDLTLSAPSCEYSPFTTGHVVAGSNRRLYSVLRALHDLTCLHNLRISLNVCDRQFWVEVPEKGIATELSGLRVLKKFVVELPHQLPEAARTMRTEILEEEARFAIERRAHARYWALESSPFFVELISWHLRGTDGDKDCWISTETISCMRNPYAAAAAQ